VSVVGNQKHQLNTALKRKAPLMLGAAASGPPPVKMAREKLYHVQSVCDLSHDVMVPWIAALITVNRVSKNCIICVIFL